MKKFDQKKYHKEWYQNKRKDKKYIEEQKRKNREYYQKVKKENPQLIKKWRKSTNKWRMTVEGIYGSLKNRNRQDFNLEKETFINWYNKQNKKCTYCNLTLEEINKLPYPYSRKNGLKKFSIDRIDSEKGYSIKNITLSCFTCNTIKNNLLDYQDMKKIGKEVLEHKFRKLLKNKI